MALARPAAGQDRLPWLDNRVHRRRRRDLRPLLIGLFALAAFAAVAGLSFWFGQRSLDEAGLAEGWPGGETVEQSVSQELPPVVVEPPVEEVEPEPVEPLPAAAPPPRARPEPSEEPRPAASAAKPRKEAAKRRPPAATSRKPAAAAPRRTVLRQSGYWPTPATAVRLGRVIQIGTYAKSKQAHDAWLKTLRRYPQTRGLPRIDSAYRARNGRIYHRVQIMTTAPAQSDWLCRRMRADGRRCVVLGSASR